MKIITAIITAVLLFTSCRQFYYKEYIEGDSIIPEYRKTVFPHSAYYYTTDKGKTIINLTALGYKLEERLFSQKVLTELSTRIYCFYPELSIRKIIPFNEKDKDNKCGLFLIALTDEISNSFFYELPIIYENDTMIHLEYNSVFFHDIESHLMAKGFTFYDLKKREDRFSKGIVKKPLVHINYYY